MVSAKDLEKRLGELETAFWSVMKVWRNVRKEQFELCGHKTIENSVGAGGAGIVVLFDNNLNPCFAPPEQVYRCVECGHVDHIEYEGFRNSEKRRKS